MKKFTSIRKRKKASKTDWNKNSPVYHKPNRIRVAVPYKISWRGNKVYHYNSTITGTAPYLKFKNTELL